MRGAGLADGGADIEGRCLERGVAEAVERAKARAAALLRPVLARRGGREFWSLSEDEVGGAVSVDSTVFADSVDACVVAGHSEAVDTVLAIGGVA